MKAWLFAVFLAALPELCMARPVAVTTGEHDGFTRLAADLPAGVVWSVEQELTGYVLRTKGSDVRFDVSQAFTRITRDRISDIRIEDQGKTLVVETGCACVIETFTANRNTAVIDIKDPTLPFAGNGPYLAQSGFDPSQDWQAAAWERLTIKPIRDVPEPLALLMRGSLQSDERSGDIFRTIAQNASGPPRIFAAPVIDATRQELISKGSLFAHMQTVPSRPATEDARLDPQDTRPGFAACLIELLQSVPEWQVEDKRQDHGLRDWHKPLHFDGSGTSADTAILIAKHYLYLGLPEEAQSYLGSVRDSGDEKPKLLFLAALLASPAAIDKSGIQSLTCEGAAFREFGTTEGGPDFNAVETRQLHAALLRLPPHLRQLLFPRLKVLFANSGGEVQAMFAELAPQMRDPASDRTDSRHPTDAPVSRMSDRELLDYVDRWPDLDAIALARLLDGIADADPRQAQELVKNLGVLKTARLPSPATLSAMAELLARYGRIDDAFVMAGADPDAQSAVWRIVGKDPNDAELLRFAAGADRSAIELLPVAVRSTVGNRLERLGFDTAAEAWRSEEDAGAIPTASGYGPQ